MAESRRDAALAEDVPGDGALTCDSFLGGRLRLTQPAHGHRSGTDAMLLAAAVPRDFSGLVYDAGAGVGAVGLSIALAGPRTRVRLVENDPTACRLAAQNCAANGLDARVDVADCNLLSVEDRRRALPEKADLLVTNPPFYDATRVRCSPEAERRSAHVMAEGATLAQWLSACLDLLAPRGTLIVLHRAEMLPAILGAIDGRAGAATLMTIYPRAGEPARRCLVRAIKGNRAPFAIAPPFVLHGDDGFTPGSAALHRGEMLLRW